MSHNLSRSKNLSHRIAEEAQLQAEEKWIIEALSKIKAQRNCLQIERLQLESMKNQLKNSTSKNIAEAAKEVKSTKARTTFSISMAAPKPPTAQPVAMVLTTPNRKLLEAEAVCNTETLQLSVSNTMLHPTVSHQYNMEEYEEEEEEERETGDDILLDMNMFMNCNQEYPPL